MSSTESKGVAFTLLPSLSTVSSRGNFLTRSLAPFLSVENTQPVGSLLSASPNSWTGILLSERSLLRIPSLERFGTEREGEGADGIRRSTPPLLYDQESVQPASQPARQPASQSASQPASQPASQLPCHAMEY